MDDVTGRPLDPLDPVGPVGPVGPESDAELLEKLAEEPGALEEFYSRHVGMVMRFLARRCRTPEDVADATSATFLAVLLSSATYDRRQGEPLRWLRSIAANEAKRIARGHQRHTALADRVRGRRLLASDDVERLSEMIDAEREAGRLGATIDGAPQGERDVVSAMVERDLTPAEAARSLGITSGAARVRLSRLRSRVRRSSPLPPGPAGDESGFSTLTHPNLDRLAPATAGSHGHLLRESNK